MRQITITDITPARDLSDKELAYWIWTQGRYFQEYKEGKTLWDDSDYIELFVNDLHELLTERANRIGLMPPTVKQQLLTLSQYWCSVFDG